MVVSSGRLLSISPTEDPGGRRTFSDLLFVGVREEWEEKGEKSAPASRGYKYPSV